MTEQGRNGAAELLPGLMAGTVWHFDEIMAYHPDALLVLDRLRPQIWEAGYRGEIRYYPIAPGGVLPGSVLEDMTAWIVSRVREGKKTVIFSSEDWGRIGYAAACALFQLGIREPEEYLKEKWSDAPLATPTQESGVYVFCHRHIAETYWHCKPRLWNVRIRDVLAVRDDPDLMNEISRIGQELGEEARILTRLSSVPPMLRVLIECPDEAVSERHMASLLEVMKKKDLLLE